MKAIIYVISKCSLLGFILIESSNMYIWSILGQSFSEMYKLMLDSHFKKEDGDLHIISYF